MNHVYRIVWSAASQTFIAVAETASGKGKRSLGKVERAIRALALAAIAAAAAPALAGPAGGSIAAGQGSIQQSGSSTTINQASSKLVINWQNFNIGAGESVAFHQPGRDSIALNRVMGAGGTEIHGSLSANGQVFIVNPNGVLFGNGASVNVGGLAASTLGISDSDFMAGNFRFSGDSKASVVNQGAISAAPGGYAALIGASASNQGLISATLGAAAVAAGSDVTLSIDNGSLASLQVSAGALRALAENQQLIQADGGRVLLTAKALDALASATVNNEGVIQARSMSKAGGVARLSGEGGSSLISNTGSIDAGALSASSRNLLQAGSIDASGSAELVASERFMQTAAGSVSAQSIRLEGAQSALVSGKAHAELDLSVAGSSLSLAAADLSAGSSLRVGGSAHGAASDIQNAQTVKVNGSSSLSVGDQGSLVVWSEKQTDFYGQARAGNHSFAEVSSKGTLKLGGSVKAGAGSQILFDPTNIVIDSSAPASSGSAPSFINLANPDPESGENHGSSKLALPNGNVAVAAPYDTFGGPEAGAVYLYDGATGALISSLHGLAYSRVGSGQFELLTNGNYVIGSPNWVNKSAQEAGAATWASQTRGVSGVVSASNSLVGSAQGDRVGFLIKPLTNGNYIASSQHWSDMRGAVAWGDGARGTSGVVSAANALVGTQANDRVGVLITPLANGNYVVASPTWANGPLAFAGAATWGDGATGVFGPVSAANSLVGAKAGDRVGIGGAVALSNGHYVVSSPMWANGSATLAGAVTWGDGFGPSSGSVSAANSLVGTQANDGVGDYGVEALANGHYVIMSPYWNNALGVSVGAATWADGSRPSSGAVSAANSLVGSQDNDKVGERVYALSNGHYVVSSPSWDDGAIYNVGAATWGDGAAGVTGEVSAANSLTGSSADDQIGLEGVTALRNGNYVVNSPYWDRHGVEDAGASTWGNGLGGTIGAVSEANSLVGSQTYDQVGYGSTALANGHYVVSSEYWAQGGNANAGAVTWGDGRFGAIGEVSSLNSLTGSLADDSVGSSVTALSNGHYVVGSPYWSGNGSESGAATWGNGLGGTLGAISAANSLVGSAAGDKVGSEIIALSNGDYAVGSPGFSYGGSELAGAITWGDGASGIKGQVTPGNSVIGSSPFQLAGFSLTPGANGSFVSYQFEMDYSGSAWLINNPRSWGGQSLSDQLGAAGDVAINPASIAAAAGAGSTVTLQASNDITVNSALHVDGALVFEAGNAITLNAAVSSQASGEALTLSSNRFVNNAGSGALETPNGRWIVYSSAPSGNAFGGLNSGSSAVWGASYGALAPGLIPAGNRYVFSFSPTVSVSASAVSREYDGSAGFGPLAYTHSGLVDASLYGGVFAQDALSGSLALSSVSKNAGSYAIGAGTLSAPGGHTLAFSGAQAVITPKTLSVLGASASPKTYDGDASASVSFGSASLSGLIAGDSAALSYGSASASFADKNAGSGKAVSVSGISLSGADASNYALAPLTLNADIERRALSVNWVIDNKVYDGSTAASFMYGSDAVMGDSLSVLASAAFADKNAGANKTVHISGASLAGADASNYTLAPTATSSASIHQRHLIISALAHNKVYDGSASAQVDLVDNRVAGDSILVSSDPFSFADKNAGYGKIVEVNGLRLSGADAGNYIHSSSAMGSADIFRRTLAVSLSASDKTYDGSAAATGALSHDALAGDDVSISASSIAFDNKNAGAPKTVTASGLSLSGSDASNYIANPWAFSTASIFKRALTISGVSAQNKTYDGSSSAVLDFSGLTLSGKVAGDALSEDLSSASAVFSDKNAGLGKTVHISGLAVSGSDAANYEATVQTSASADIHQRALAVTASAQSKTYDGSASAAFWLSDNRVAGDQLSISASAAFSDKNAGLNKTVNVTGIELSGADASNYTAPSTAQASADIHQRALNVSLLAQSKTYDGTASAAGSLSDDRLAGDELTVSADGGLWFSDKNAGAGKTVTASGLSLSGADAANYAVSGLAQATADIDKKALVVSGLAAQSKTYDGTTQAAIDASGASFSGQIAGDDLSIDASRLSGSFADKNAGSGKTVSVQGAALSGADAANYQASLQTSATADIHQRALTLSASAQSKTYDGSASASAFFSDNRLAGDDLSISGSAAFSDKNAGLGKTVTVSGISLSGSDASNYALASSEALASADIHQRALSVSANAQSKTYDGSRLASATLSDNRVLGDSLSVSGSAAFSDKNAGLGKTVTVSGISLSGADAANYALASSEALASADIDPKALLVSGVSAQSKIYDGSAAAAIDASSARVEGIVAGDSVLVDASGARGLFSDKNAGLGKNVLIEGLSLSGADAANYSASARSSASADILKRSVSLVGARASSKTYDGSAAAGIDLSAAFVEGLIEGDAASAGPIQGAFEDKNAGAGKTVRLSGLSLLGADASNYELASSERLSADIRVKEVSIEGLRALGKRFDGSNSASIDASGARLLGAIAGDQVALAPGLFGLFADASAGSGKAVSLSGLSLSGADAANYALAAAPALSADISPAPALPYPELAGSPAAEPLARGAVDERSAEEELRRRQSASAQSATASWRDRLGLAIEDDGVRGPERPASSAPAR